MKIKKIYIILAALLLVFFPYFTISANDSDVTVINTPIASQKALQQAINSLDIMGGEIRLSQDISLSSTLYFPQDNPVTIDGNGHKLSMASGVQSRHISISSINNNITLKNLTLVGNGAGNVGGGISVNGKVNIENCAIENNFAHNGGGIIISGGTVVMKRSKVSANGSYGYGGGIHISSNGVLAAYDSEFAGNKATRGGAIFATGGNSTQYAVYAENCNIDGNTAEPHGNDLVMGGGIAAEGENTGVKLLGGRLSENYSTGMAGGIYAGGMLEAVDCEITANSTAGNGGGVYVAHKALISDGQIRYNNAAGSGGGIYTDTKALKHFSVKGTCFGENQAGCYINWHADSLLGATGEIYSLLLSSGTVSVSEYTRQGGKEANVFNDADINIMAKCDIIFSAGGGEWMDKSGKDMVEPYYLGDSIRQPGGLSKDGHRPVGWKTVDGDIIGEDYRVTGPVTLYPVWEQPAADETDGLQTAAADGFEESQTPASEGHPSVKTYTVLYMLEGSSFTRSETVAVGSKANAPIVYFEGHKLKGWFISGTDVKWDYNNDTVSSDLTLEARWE